MLGEGRSKPALNLPVHQIPCRNLVRRFGSFGIPMMEELYGEIGSIISPGNTPQEALNEFLDQIINSGR
jgi:hypothetical protein